MRRARSRAAIGEDRSGGARQQFVERVDLRMAEPRMADRDRGIGQSFGGAGGPDLLAQRRRRLLAVGAVVDDQRKAIRLGCGDIVYRSEEQTSEIQSIMSLQY